MNDVLNDEARICGTDVLDSSGQGPATRESVSRTRRLLSSAVTDTSPVLRGTTRPRITPDEVTAAFVVERVAEVVGLEDRERLPGLVERLLSIATDVFLDEVDASAPDMLPATPDDRLTQALRRASGYSATGVPDVEEGRRLARTAVDGVLGLLGWSADGVRTFLATPVVAGDDDPDDPDDPVDELADAVWDEPDPPADDTPVWEEPDAPPDDPLVAAVHAVGAAVAPTAGTTGLDVARGLGRKHLTKLHKLATPHPLRRVLRAYQARWASLRPSSPEDGRRAEALIRAAYQAAHPGCRILGDTRVYPGGTRLSEVTDTVWSATRGLLLNLLTGRLRRPDLLDVDRRHVYEVKPMRSAAKGAAQLATLLFWMNLGEIAAVNLGVLTRAEIAAWAAWAVRRGSAAPPFPLRDRPVATVEAFWRPGPWRPPKWLPDGDRILETYMLPEAPGVILYRFLGRPRSTAPATAPATDPAAMAALLVALVAVRAAVVEAGRAVGGDDRGAEAMARWLDLESVPVADDDAVHDVLVVAGAVLLVIALGALLVVTWPVVVSVGAAVKAILVGGGAVALAGAAATATG